MNEQLSPLVLYLQILGISGLECYIESLYGSWTTQRYNKLRNKPLEPKLEGGGDNRSVAILTDLPVSVEGLST